MRNRSLRLAKRQTLHFLAMPGAGQQDLGGQGAFVANAAIRQQSRGAAEAGRGDRRPHADGAGRLLSTALRTRRQGQSGDRNRTQDRHPVLQRVATWNRLRRPRRFLLRGQISRPRSGQPSTPREVSRLRAARDADASVVSQEVRACRGAATLGRCETAPRLVRQATRSRSDPPRVHRRDLGFDEHGAHARTLSARPKVTRRRSARPLQDGYARRRPAPLRPRGAKGLRPADQRGLVRGMGGKMSCAHPLERRHRRHGQSVEPQGTQGRATHKRRPEPNCDICRLTAPT